MPRTWKLMLKSNAPSRVCWTYGDLQREIEYYDVSQTAMARFLGMGRARMCSNIGNLPEKELPRAYRQLLALLSQFPTVWVRNRILGLIDIDYRDSSNATRQRGFQEGAS